MISAPNLDIGRIKFRQRHGNLEQLSATLSAIMSPVSNPPEAISVLPEDNRWTWSAHGEGRHLTGEASNSTEAWKTAAFAAGALRAISRMTRRRF